MLLRKFSTARRIFAGAAAILASFTLSSIASAQEIVIGALLPLTGPAAPIGLEEQQGIEFAVDKINAAGGVRGRKIKIMYEDSQGKPDVGVLAFNKLVDLHNVPAVMTAFSSVSLAIAPLATRKKVLVINPAAQSNQLADASPYMINTIPLVGDETAVLAKYLYSVAGKRTAAVVYENASAGTDGRDDFKKAFTALGGTIVADEAVEFGQTNFRPTLLKVAAAKPDLVYFVLTVGHPTLVEQVSQIPGFPVAAGTTFMRPSFGLPGSIGWYQSAIKSGISPELEEEFKAKFKTKDMHFFGREYSNSTNLLFKTIDHVLEKGGTISGESLRAAVFEIKKFGSSVTTITFDKTNTASRGVEIQQYGKDARNILAVAEDR
jgi:branched-chain amino acid transport system substrate-binding protein